MSLAAMEEGTFVFHDSTVDPGEIFTTAVDGENEITTRYTKITINRVHLVKYNNGLYI